ncbi:5-formyltetrahydrofolate cyclo-ligase [Candidatus Peregrinibacteria bacterium]|nr:5-formyltetrahydrofolate cyclo-ligase [Candidatus Peregrinibacteria bacterium]
MHIRDEKAQLRQSIKDRLDRYPERKMRAESRSIGRRILEAIPDPPITIAGFYPLTHEADILPLLQDLLDRGDRVYLPRFKNNVLTFAKIEGLDNLTPGALNIPEPPLDAPDLDPSTVDVVLVPGRAFDRMGNRLGRGNGGYDVWIENVRAIKPSAQFMGVALECQIVEKIPSEPHDQKMDAIATAREVIDT